MYIYIYVCMYICIYDGMLIHIYIYIFIHIPSQNSQSSQIAGTKSLSPRRSRWISAACAGAWPKDERTAATPAPEPDGSETHGFLLDFHGISMGFLCDFYRILWDFMGFYEFLGDFMGF